MHGTFNGLPLERIIAVKTTRPNCRRHPYYLSAAEPSLRQSWKSVCNRTLQLCSSSLRRKLKGRLGDDAFVLKWVAIPANIVAGRDWITILTAGYRSG